jgi:hypothetical protein
MSIDLIVSVRLARFLFAQMSSSMGFYPITKYVLQDRVEGLEQ